MPAREVISVRVSRETAAAIDAARGSLSRARWVENVIESGLSQATTDKAAPKVLADSKEETVPPCPHPRARVIKGFCYRCGKMVNL